MFQMAATASRFRPFEGPFAAIYRPLGPLRAHSSPGLSQKRSAHHPQIGERKHRVQLRRVLGQAAVAHLHVPELALDDTERVLHHEPRFRVPRAPLILPSLRQLNIGCQLLSCAAVGRQFVQPWRTFGISRGSGRSGSGANPKVEAP